MRWSRLNAAYVHRVERLISLVGLVTTPLAIGLILGSLTGYPPWEILDRWDWEVKTIRFLTSLGLLTTVLTSMGIIAAASRMRTSESARKHFGILWDLTTFWPRAAHPLAPPCYAERVVPELLTRVHWALDADNETNNVVLSAHSQGTYLALSAASRLTDDDLKRTRIVTYGCQLRAWYGRIFPGVFGPDSAGYVPTKGVSAFSEPYPDTQFRKVEVPSQIDGQGHSLRERLDSVPGEPRWVNLFRRSDPLGFHVFDDADNNLDILVLEVPTKDKGDPGPQVQGHGNYWHSDAYIGEIERWIAEMPNADARPSIVKDDFFPES